MMNIRLLYAYYIHFVVGCFIRLAVATLECFRLICAHFSSTFVSSMISSVWVPVVSVVRVPFILFYDSQHTGAFPVQ
jgi:hypothetical protein